MAPQFHKLVYQPDPQSSESYVMIVDADTVCSYLALPIIFEN